MVPEVQAGRIILITIRWLETRQAKGSRASQQPDNRKV